MTGLLQWMSSQAEAGKMISAAQKGWGDLGREVYSQLPAEMTRAPSNGLAAYKQATYFLAVAVRRADTTNEELPADALLNALDEFLSDAEVLEGQAGTLCRWGGVLCPGGAPAILQRAIDTIEASGLNVDDRTRIVAILRSNRRSAQISQAMPYVGLVGVGAVLGTWFWYSRRS